MPAPSLQLLAQVKTKGGWVFSMPPFAKSLVELKNSCHLKVLINVIEVKGITHGFTFRPNLN